MTLRLGLRWKILLLVLVTPATLAVATLLTVQRNVTAHVDSSSIHESLAHSVSVFESLLATRARELAGGARVIARDPRFFSLIMLGPGQHDARFAATVRATARDFSALAPSDLFEVFDRRGERLASVGPARTARDTRMPLMRRALRGEVAEGVLVQGRVPFQVVCMPIVADGRRAGVLLMGRALDQALAQELRGMMRCEVSFVDRGDIVGTTLEVASDRGALQRALAGMDLGPAAALERAPVRRVAGPHLTHLTLVRHVPGSDPGARLHYVLQRSLDPELAFRNTMRQDLVVLAVIALLAAAATGLLFGGHVVRPVRRLVRAAQAMERGDYDHPLEVRGGDELGYLAERFAETRRRERAYLGSLEHTQRVKSRFLSVVSHELRTPISVLAGYCDLLGQGGLGPVSEPQRRAVATMREHLGRLTRLAEEAARFAQVKSERVVLDLKPQRVAALVHGAVIAARAAGASRAVEVEERVAADIGPAEVDGESLEQAVFQLVANAIRFTPDGGRVEVVAAEADGRLCITVRDTGVGMDAERLEQVLGDRFAATDPLQHRTSAGLEFDVPGLGLGLSIASAIARAHGGTLGATSAPGAGSTFTLEVPMRPAHPEQAAA
jgi:signal transduction histidine kinase